MLSFGTIFTHMLLFQYHLINFLIFDIFKTFAVSHFTKFSKILLCCVIPQAVDINMHDAYLKQEVFILGEKKINLITSAALDGVRLKII